VARMGEERIVYKVFVGEHHSQDQGVGGRMGSERILGRLTVGCVNWTRLAQYREPWRAVVDAVMNLRVLAPRSYLINNTLL
jgi:hypothetical protein